jgi:hypothetical protein
MKLRSILISLDIWAAFAAAIAAYSLFPKWVPNEVAKDLFGVGIGVLSIIFSVFFAALAIIMAATDDEFLRFLNSEGDYDAIIATFKYTLILLFSALITSLVLYARSAVLLSSSVKHQSRWFMEVFSFLFLYSLFASLSATRDAIRYSEFRSQFVMLSPNSNQVKK